MRILVTGKNGQLGRSIQKTVNADTKIGNNQSPNDFIFVGREELDLSSESSISTVSYTHLTLPTNREV